MATVIQCWGVSCICGKRSTIRHRGREGPGTICYQTTIESHIQAKPSRLVKANDVMNNINSLYPPKNHELKTGGKINCSIVSSKSLPHGKEWRKGDVQCSLVWMSPCHSPPPLQSSSVRSSIKLMWWMTSVSPLFLISSPIRGRTRQNTRMLP